MDLGVLVYIEWYCYPICSKSYGDLYGKSFTCIRPLMEVAFEEVNVKCTYLLVCLLHGHKARPHPRLRWKYSA
jgi:hypothetical protein